jgi:hypothetical protein
MGTILPLRYEKDKHTMHRKFLETRQKSKTPIARKLAEIVQMLVGGVSEPTFFSPQSVDH